MKSGDEKTGQSRPKLCPCYERRDSKRDFSNPPLMQSDLRAIEFQLEPFISRVFWLAGYASFKPWPFAPVCLLILLVTVALPIASQPVASTTGNAILLPKARPEIVRYNQIWYANYFVSVAWGL